MLGCVPIELWSRKHGYIQPPAELLHAEQDSRRFPTSFRERGIRWVDSLFTSIQMYSPMGDVSNEASASWTRLHTELRAKYGRARFVRPKAALIDQLVDARGNDTLYEDAPAAELAAHVRQCPDTEVMDFISAGLQIAAEITGIDYQLHLDERVDEHVNELNRIFAEEGIGYRCVRGDLIRFDDDFTHGEAIAPALESLRRGRFGKADSEFTSAVTDYRCGDYPDAITKANAAFESVLKIITGEQHKTAGDLIKELRKLTDVPGSLITGADHLYKLMQAVPAVRNQQSSSHGGGAANNGPDRPLAQLILTLVAGFIVYLAAQSE
jgi:hypothetical protein